METKDFYRPEDLSRLKQKEKRERVWVWALAGLTLALCVLFCCLTNTANAGRMETATLITSCIGGWLVIYGRVFGVQEARYEREHAAYLIGAIPWGWIFVWLVKHKDIRYIASGRMGMSNVMRTAGTFWGILTAVMDVLKGVAAVLAARLFVSAPEPWMTAAGGFFAVVGHIYSVYMIEKHRDGKFYFGVQIRHTYSSRVVV